MSYSDFQKKWNMADNITSFEVLPAHNSYKSGSLADIAKVISLTSPALTTAHNYAKIYLTFYWYQPGSVLSGSSKFNLVSSLNYSSSTFCAISATTANPSSVDYIAEGRNSVNELVQNYSSVYNIVLDWTDTAEPLSAFLDMSLDLTELYPKDINIDLYYSVNPVLFSSQQEAQDYTELLNTIISKLSDIGYDVKLIGGNTTAIYKYMQTYYADFLTALQSLDTNVSELKSLVAAMNHDDIIALLNEISSKLDTLNTTIGTTNDHLSVISDLLQQWYQEIEDTGYNQELEWRNDYNSNNMETVDKFETEKRQQAKDSMNSIFSSGSGLSNFSSAFALIGNMFGLCWNGLGSLYIVVYLPLVFALAGVLIGRAERSARSSRRDTDSSGGDS